MSRRSRDLFFVGDFEKRKMRELIAALMKDYEEKLKKANKVIRTYQAGERP